MHLGATTPFMVEVQVQAIPWATVTLSSEPRPEFLMRSAVLTRTSAPVPVSISGPNSFFGAGAGISNTFGINNSFFGWGAGNSSTTGNQNTFIGTSGRMNVGGSNNTAVGYGADVSSPSLNFATAIGAGAVVGSSNTIVLGRSAGQDVVLIPSDLIVTGILNANLPAGSGNYIQNSAIPQASSNFNISGNGTADIFNAATQYNLAGNRVLSAAGNDNSLAGRGAGIVNAGSANAFFGRDSGRFNALGGGNSFFGAFAGFKNDDAGNNSYFGASAGFNKVSGSGNTFLGSSAGTGFTAGIGNTLVGFEANAPFPSTLNNATAVGGRAFVTQSNSLVLGSIAGVNNAAGDTNVGIGTTAPAERLHVVGNALVTGNLAIAGTINGTVSNATTANNALNLGGVAANQYVVTTDPRMSDARLPTAGSANYIQNRATQQAASNFNISGNGAIGGTFGIGTSNPAAKLDVTGTGIIRARINSDSNGGISLELNNQPKWSVATVTGGNFQIFNDANSQNTFWIDTASNNVGIGTTATSFKLHIVDTSNAGLRVQNDKAGGTVASFGGTGAFYIDSPGIVGGRLAITEDGNVGIGTATPNTKLHVAGAIQFDAFGVAGSTNLCANAFVQIATCSSSIRYKQDVKPFGSGFALINRLRPVSFHWKTDNKADLGLIAEEVATVEPLLVTHNDKGEIEGVKYDRINVVLINAVKEQQEQIAEQKQQNEALQKQVEEQSKIIKGQQAELEALKSFVCSQNPKADFCQPNK